MKASVRKAATLRRPATPRNNDRRVLGPHPRRRFLRLAAGTAVLPATMLAYLARRPANRLIRWRGERYIPKNVFFLR